MCFKCVYLFQFIDFPLEYVAPLAQDVFPIKRMEKIWKLTYGTIKIGKFILTTQIHKKFKGHTLSWLNIPEKIKYNNLYTF